MDKETQEVFTEQKSLKSLVGHPGWGLARQKFVDKILALQTVGQIADTLEEGNALKFMIEVKGNKKAAEEMFDFLREIEGTAQQADEVKIVDSSYIVRKE